MKSRRIPTIRSRLALLVIACVIPASLMAVALISYNYQRERARLVRDSIATARALTSAMDRELAGVQSALVALATSPHLSSDNLRAFYNQAKEVLPILIANNIVLLDASGQQRVNTLRSFGELLPSQASNQLGHIFETGRPVTTDLFPGPVVDSPIVAIGVPVRRGGTIVYVLSTGIVPERLAGILTQQRLPPDWIAAIFDSTGTTVARTHEMTRFLGKKGNPALVRRMSEVAEDSIEVTTLEGIPVLTVFSRSAVSSWTVAIGIPTRDLTGELWHSLWWLVLGLVLLLLCSLILAGAIGGRISRSIHRLSDAALALGLGEAVTVPPLHLKEADEVGQALIRASKVLKEAQWRFRATVESAPTAIVMIDDAGDIVLANAEMKRLFGFEQDELLHLTIEVLVPDRFRSKHPALRAEYFASPTPRSMGAGRDLYGRRKDGTEFPVEIGLSPVKIDQSLFVLAGIVDITERKRQMDELKNSNQALERSNIELLQAQHRAHHNALTGLANRALFNEIVDHQLALCARTGIPLAVLYVDLDGFKAVNDTHGHATGDQLLCAVAARLKNGIRSSDLAARLGGDEFAIVLVNTSMEAAATVVGKLADSVSMPYPIGPLTIEISASIGVAEYPESGTSSEALLRSADEAMYQAKAGRKRRIRAHDAA